MDKVRIEKVRPGMILAKNVYQTGGVILLGAGTVLGREYIAKLTNLGIPSVYIKDSLSDTIIVPEIVAEATRLKTQQAVREIFHNVESSSMISLGQSRKLVEDIIEEIVKDDEVMVQLNDIRTYDDEIFGHSVSVGILSIMIGSIMGFGGEHLVNLGMGSLLHDIGKVTIAPEILNKPGKLTAQEFEVIKSHSLSGYHILRDLEDADMLSANIALQHHERYDGSGYPKGLKDRLIQQYARVTAIADVYDAVTSDRIYRPAFSAQDAVLTLQDGAGTLYDPQMVTSFVKYVAYFPVGAIVELNTKEVGVVTRTQVGEPERPVVMIILNKHRQKVNQIVDLLEDHSREIVRVLNHEDETLPSVVTLGGRIIGKV